MSITDELREWFDRYTMRKDVYDELLAIADRIDAEHEKAIHELNGFAEVSVLLPKDANGEPWHLGDELMMEGEVCDVVGIGDKTIFYAFGNDVDWTIAHNNHHHHALTVEDVLREFAEKIIDSQIPNVHPTYEESIAEYATKLRLAGDDE